MNASRVATVTSAASPVAPRAGTLARTLAIVRRLIGVPDYDAYVAHMHAHHPACALLSRDDFLRERLVDKYSRPGTRCC